MKYIVNISWDSSAGVWYAVCDEIPLALESNSFDALIEKVKVTAYEMLEINNKLTNDVQLCFKTERWEQIA